LRPSRIVEVHRGLDNTKISGEPPPWRLARPLHLVVLRPAAASDCCALVASGVDARTVTESPVTPASLHDGQHTYDKSDEGKESDCRESLNGIGLNSSPGRVGIKTMAGADEANETDQEGNRTKAE
jgi:hypothetical protein